MTTVGQRRAEPSTSTQPLSGGRVVWFWTITGPYIPSDLRPSQGEAASLIEAKAEFRAKFDAWLAWAQGLQQPVM